MKKLSITINKKKHEIKFTFMSLRIFLEFYGETKFSALDKYLSKIMITDGSEPEFDFYDTLANVILSGILNAAQTEVAVTQNEIVDAIINSVMAKDGSIETILAGFAEIIPQETADSLGKSNKVKPNKVKPKKK